MQRRIIIAGWWLFGLAMLCLVAGIVAQRISSHAYITPLALTAGQTVEVPVLRLEPGSVRLMAWHAYQGDDQRPELGSYSHEIVNGSWYVKDPGEPLIVQVATALGSVVYEAEPRGGRGAHIISRDLTPQAPDGDPHLLQGPLQPDAARLPAGRSTVRYTVLDVGPTLQGETVEIVLEPMLGFKSSASRYDFLWLFFFWPLPAIALAVLGVLWALLHWRVLVRSSPKPDAG